MTATNHALAGAVIALAVKNPLLAIPLALASHFVLDAIPHYNPSGVYRERVKNIPEGWSKKLKDKWFLPLFALDMFLLVIFLLLIPLISTEASPWTVFFSMLAAISPDFVAGRYLIYKVIGFHPKNPDKKSRFTKFHIWVQWMERPWGLLIEAVWFIAMLWLIIDLSS